MADCAPTITKQHSRKIEEQKTPHPQTERNRENIEEPKSKYRTGEKVDSAAATSSTDWAIRNLWIAARVRPLVVQQVPNSEPHNVNRCQLQLSVHGLLAVSYPQSRPCSLERCDVHPPHFHGKIGLFYCCCGASASISPPIYQRSYPGYPPSSVSQHKRARKAEATFQINPYLLPTQ